MARSKRTRQPRRPKDDHKEQEYSEPDPNSDDYFHDDVDKFHAEREKILLDSTAYDKDGQGQSSDESGQDEEVMALNIDEFDDEDGDYDDDDDGDDGSVAEDNDSAEENEELDEEEQESENEKDMEKGFPSQKSWGKKKSAFYDADIVEEYAGSDEEMDKLAEEEEEEALALQRQMAASLEEQDFDADQFELPQPTQKSDREQDDLDKERIVQDLSKLSKAEKIQILMKDSPELLHLMDEFKSKLKEVIEKLHPLVQMARAGQIPKEGANYLELKHQLYLNYCINIGFYFLLKAKKMSVRDHPVMERLVQYQKLITELKPLDEKLKPEVELFLLQSRVTEQDGSQEEFDFRSVRSKKTTKKPSKRPAKLSTLLDDDDDDDDDDVEFGTRVKTSDTSVKDKEEQLKGKKKAKKRKRKGEGETGAMDPLEYYEAVKLQKRKKKEAKEAVFRFTEQQEVDKDDIEEGKRGITYEISQNKGLTAKKKKELRNPRVKHRKKFYKAKIKRKSQVLPVANEQNRYGGEMTGIRSHLTRSIKIK